MLLGRKSGYNGMLDNVKDDKTNINFGFERDSGLRYIYGTWRKSDKS